MFIKKRTCQNSPEKSYTEKKISFDKKENKLNYYKGKDCIEELCKKLRECAMEINDYKEKK